MHLASSSLLDSLVSDPYHVPRREDDRVMVAKAVFQRLYPVEMEAIRVWDSPEALLAFWRTWEPLQPLKDLLRAAQQGPKQLKAAIRKVLPSRGAEEKQAVATAAVEAKRKRQEAKATMKDEEEQEEEEQGGEEDGEEREEEEEEKEGTNDEEEEVEEEEAPRARRGARTRLSLPE